jgi:hypothetical protein
MPAPDPSNKAPSLDQVTVTCLYCGKPQEVARRAQTVTCKHCYKRLELQDLVFSKYDARRAIETTGIVTVEKKGNVIADRIVCGGLIVRGKVKGSVSSRGPVLVGPEADLIGDVKAPSMAIGAGAVLQGHYQVGRTLEPPEPAPTPAPSLRKTSHPVVSEVVESEVIDPEA